MTKAVITVLTSGGLDSTTCLSYYLAGGYTVRALWIDYGQAAAFAEEKAVEQVIDYYQVPLQKVCIKGIIWPKLGGELLEYQGRNLTLVSLALNTAPVEPGIIALGIHQGTTFADCTIPFREKLDDLLFFLSNGRFRLDCPFISWSKQNIADYAFSKAVPLNLLYSCERGLLPPCKECVKCRDLQMIMNALETRSTTSGRELYS